MASLPPSQRRTSPPQRTTSSDLPADTRSLGDESAAASEDSETVLLSPVTSPAERPAQIQAAEAQIPKTTTGPPLQEEDEPRKCWICFADETEDTPLSTEWRSPCPCALTAHEGCLLDWIADLELPNSRRSRQGRSQKIQCPQCKSEIIVARPRNWVVDSVAKIEDTCSRAILPSLLLVSASSIFRLFFEYGVLSIEVVFGPTDAYHLLEPLFEPPTPGKSVWRDIASSFKTSVRLSAGLVSIPPLLILSRTSIADGILPILPMLFLATTPSQDPLMDIGAWPPSAGLSFALLPYVRSAYNIYYERIWAEREKKWLREIQPRAESAENDNDGTDLGNAAADEVLAGDGNVIQIDLNFDVAAEDDDEEMQRIRDEIAALPDEGVEVGQAPPLHAPPLGDNDNEEVNHAAEPAAGREGQEQAQNQRPAVAAANPQPPADPGQGRALNLNISTNRLADTLLGALAFPFVSSVAGDILRLVLPKAWTAAPRVGTKPTLFFQSRWARSLVGGCMFVVFKDAVMLYVRWKMAQTHRKRKVLNYDKVKKRIIYD